MNTTIGEIARLIGTELPDNCPNIVIERLLTDSRSLSDPEGTLFFAIPSASTDATRFMRPLYDKGVRCFVASAVPADMEDAADAVILLHPDPMAALQSLASRRRSMGGEVVAITGSKGKTTLKEWIFQLMSSLRNTVRSPRSYNSQIGVPLSMWEITHNTRLTLIEAGISRSGEMARLAECIRPDVVIITSIDDEHDEGFESHEEKVAEKLSLAAAPSVRRVIYCADDDEVAKAAASLPEDVEHFTWTCHNRFGARLRIIGVTPIERLGRRLQKISFISGAELNAIEVDARDDLDLRNACSALAFMISTKVPIKTIIENFRDVHPISTRLSVVDGQRGCSLIYDSYTSDFSSLEPAVDFMMRRRTPRQKTVVVLTPFQHKERGSGRQEYEKAARMLSLRGVDRIIGVGAEMHRYDRLFGHHFRSFYTPQMLFDYLRECPFENSCVLIKGNPDYDLSRISEIMEVRTHETHLEVNLESLIHNYNYFRSHVPATTGMIAMVKASGYGVGSYEIAKTLQDAGASYLAVAVLDEGVALRERGITMPIMVMNPRVADYTTMFANRLEPEIYNAGMLQDVIRQAAAEGLTAYPVHVKLDTGMHRMGFTEDELPSLMDTLSGQTNIRVATVFSHLATADMTDMDDYTRMQLECFDRCTEYMLSRSETPFRRHVLNSAGILRFPEYHYDLVRLGIGLYGVNTLPADIERPLEPVATLQTVVIHVHEWPAGTTVGYARRGLLKRASRVATIPIGYADGMNRHFGNGAIKVLVNGAEVPTIGNICMDACMIDITGVDCHVGDVVEIFGRNLPISRLADVLDTIPYEVLTSVSPRVKRVYYRD